MNEQRTKIIAVRATPSEKKVVDRIRIMKDGRLRLSHPDDVLSLLNVMGITSVKFRGNLGSGLEGNHRRSASRAAAC